MQTFRIMFVMFELRVSFQEENLGASIKSLAPGGMDSDKFNADRDLLPLCDHVKMHADFANSVRFLKMFYGCQRFF